MFIIVGTTFSPQLQLYLPEPDFPPFILLKLEDFLENFPPLKDFKFGAFLGLLPPLNNLSYFYLFPIFLHFNKLLLINMFSYLL